jgi:hypothetical protein
MKNASVSGEYCLFRGHLSHMMRRNMAAQSEAKISTDS